MKGFDWLFLTPTLWMVLYFAVLLHVLPQDSFGADEGGIGFAVSTVTFLLVLPAAVLGLIVVGVRWAIRAFGG